MSWRTLKPNEHGDWISQRNDVFETFIPIGDRKVDKTFFKLGLFCRGLETARDAWTYNSSTKLLTDNIYKSIDFYNTQLRLFNEKKQEKQEVIAKEFVAYDDTKISWSRAFINDLDNNQTKKFDTNGIRASLYRPYYKQMLYFSREFNNVVSKMDSYFPTSSQENQIICISGLGGNKDNSTIITDKIPDLNCLDAGTQCFPLYYYEERKVQQRTLFDTDDGEGDYIRRDGISDFILERAKKQYGKNVTKEDIFYYVYGFLHSPEYRTKFANDLKKMLPRLPLVEDVRDFWAFSKAGRKLADLHINYESVPPYEGVKVLESEQSGLDFKSNPDYYKVQKMRFSKKDQKDTIIYNSRITITNIPPDAYNYVVNGKSAIEWIMERYQVTIHKQSGIKNDPNDWATEVGNPRYILDLLLSIINVSMQTNEIVRGLPKVEFE